MRTLYPELKIASLFRSDHDMMSCHRLSASSAHCYLGYHFCFFTDGDGGRRVASEAGACTPVNRGSNCVTNAFEKASSEKRATELRALVAILPRAVSAAVV